MTLFKDLYEQGNDEVKRTIAQSWSISQ